MSSTPDFAESLRVHVESVPAATRPRLLATLERGAAQRYRAWASAAEPRAAAGLLDCATREEEIATRVEGCFPSDAEQERRIAAVLPEIARLYGAALAGIPVEQQYAIQAAAERRGAALWRALAASLDEPKTRETLLACAVLEERSAEFLEALPGGR